MLILILIIIILLILLIYKNLKIKTKIKIILNNLKIKLLNFFFFSIKYLLIPFSTYFFFKNINKFKFFFKYIIKNKTSFYYFNKIKFFINKFNFINKLNFNKYLLNLPLLLKNTLEDQNLIKSISDFNFDEDQKLKLKSEIEIYDLYRLKSGNILSSISSLLDLKIRYKNQIQKLTNLINLEQNIIKKQNMLNDLKYLEIFFNYNNEKLELANSLLNNYIIPIDEIYNINFSNNNFSSFKKNLILIELFNNLNFNYNIIYNIKNYYELNNIKKNNINFKAKNININTNTNNNNNNFFKKTFKFFFNNNITNTIYNFFFCKFDFVKNYNLNKLKKNFKINNKINLQKISNLKNFNINNCNKNLKELLNLKNNNLPFYNYFKNKQLDFFNQYNENESNFVGHILDHQNIIKDFENKNY